MKAALTRGYSWLGTRRRFFLVIAVLLAVQLLFQLLYPADTALPNASLYQANVAGKHRNSLAAVITEGFQKEMVTLKTPTTSYKTSLASLGASVNSDSAAAELTRYPLWQRLLPFSIVWLRPNVTHYDVSFSTDVLHEASNKAAQQLSAEPIDAGLAITKGELVVSKAKDGQVVQPDSVRSLVKKTDFTPDTQPLQVPATRKQPAVADASVAEVKKQAEAIVARSYTLQAADGKEIHPTKADVASWLQITTENGKVAVEPDSKGIAAYIKKLNSSLGKPGTPAQVRMTDGVEVSRKSGVPGSAINSADMSAKLVAAIKGSEAAVVPITMRSVSPPDSVSRSYTSSEKGLRAYVAYLSNSENVRIAVMQLGGNGWSAYGNASSSMVSASTYKLYVAVWVAAQVKAGKMKLSDTMLDTTVKGCLERMIVVSDNACAEAWVKKAGPSKLNDFLYGKGISRATTFTAADATHTSAADLQKVASGIWNGSMISGSLRDTIVGYMGRQVYRQGIPAGSKGSVYDKVGFLWDYLNDVAIVTHPKGTYSLVIMTKGSSWGRIAEITRQVEKILY